MTDLMTLTPTLLKQLPLDALSALAADIRTFLIDTVSRTGGHIGANLGVIELTIALHYVFDSPQDKLLFDTGHQGYTHRILTGRAEQFPGLNSFNGMSRFLQRSDSPHDIMDATHAGTALSTAVGLAQAMRAAGDLHRVVAVVGDGTLGEGLTFEGLNYLADTDLPVIVVLNDNGMAIPPTVGGIRQLGIQTESPPPAAAFFEALGFSYWDICDGHDCETLINRLRIARRSTCPEIIHVKTEKGRGLPCAATHPYRMHFSMPFDPVTGAGASPTVTGRTYATVAAEELARIMARDEAITVLTPGTPYASGLEPVMAQFPTRVIDVGMAEQHAVSMAAGLALGGQKPVVCIQSTFLQRAYDQVLHDVCYMGLPVTFLCVRSGFAGFDGATHHGLYDIPILRSFPNMQLHYAMDTRDLTETLAQRLAQPQGPLALLMPYEPVADPEPDIGVRHDGCAIVSMGNDGTIFCLGNTFATALAVRRLMQTQYHEDFGVVCIGRLKPFPREELRTMLMPYVYPRFVSIEEGIEDGGLADLVVSLHTSHTSHLRIGTAGCFVPAGSKDECSAWARMAPQQIVERIVARWGAPVFDEVLLQAGPKIGGMTPKKE